MGVPFVFKQFRLEQEKSAFKLGTDSVVLGSWLPAKSYKRVLDIGTGTGILSLMVAQRFADARVVAIELDSASAMDCANNFTHSNWNNRLTMFNEDALEWSKKNPLEKFDLLISNPPYFNNSLQNPDTRLSTARHSISLNSTILSEMVKRHLAPLGHFALILPATEFNEMHVQLAKEHIFAQHICAFSSFEHSEIIRKMAIFSFLNEPTLTEVQYLYNADKTRSPWYKNISQDFYIK